MSSDPTPPPAAARALWVTEKRNARYGPSTEITARLWSAFLDKPVLPEDVALMMVLFKMGRELSSRNRDNLVDMHGYLIVYERMQDAVVGTTEEPSEMVGSQLSEPEAP